MVAKLGCLSQNIEKNRNFYIKQIEEARKQIYLKIDEMTSNFIETNEKFEEELSKINAKLGLKKNAFNMPFENSPFYQQPFPVMGMMKPPSILPWSSS